MFTYVHNKETVWDYATNISMVIELTVCIWTRFTSPVLQLSNVHMVPTYLHLTTQAIALMVS